MKTISRNSCTRGRKRNRSRLLLESLEPRVLLTDVAVIGLTATMDGATTYSGVTGSLTVANITHAYGIDAISFGGTTGDGTGQTIERTMLSQASQIITTAASRVCGLGPG